PNFTPDVCLTDGSQFKYGTFDESCTDNICDTLTIDTNGKKGPNTAGKDRFTINLTPNGLKALGESDTCSTGYDCGAYILAHHKLWTGEVEITQTPVIPEGCTDEECNVKIIKNGDYETSAYKVTLSDGSYIYLSDVINYMESVPSGTFNAHWCGSSTCPDWWSGAKKTCEDKGMSLPNDEQLALIYEQKQQDRVPTGGAFWSSTPYDGDERYAYYFDMSTGTSGHTTGKAYDGITPPGVDTFCVSN
ncbi:hypothetical protein IJ732_06265, partial [bacterium]|nr:hypothetical protein [bacterium]